MNYSRLILSGTLLTAIAAPATAQQDRSGMGSQTTQAMREIPQDRNRPAEKESKKKGVNPKDAKLINDALAAGNAKSQAGDNAGAVALYDDALAKVGKDAPRQYLLVGKAGAQRRIAVAAYRNGPQPQYPGVGASNDEIRAANASNAALQAKKSADALPPLKLALSTAAEAATIADAGTDRTTDESIGVELRENADLLYRLGAADVLATPRPTIDLEVAWLRKWLASDPALAGSLVAKGGIPVAAALSAKDPAAGLALADELKAKVGNDPEGVIGYAEIVAAKAPAGDPRRAQALAAVTAIGGSVVDQQKSRVEKVKPLLSKPS